MRHLRILLVDDHEVVRLGLKALLGRYPQFDVVAEASNADEAVLKAQQQRPDVVVMDIRMPGRSGIEATREIKGLFPEMEVIVLTSYAEDDLLFDAIRAGASGYVLKQIGSDDLLSALEAVGRGEALLDPKLTRRVFNRVRDAQRIAEGSVFAELTEQELRVLAQVAEGSTNKEIAQQLHLSNGTVRNYVSNLMHKLGVSNRAEAAAFAVQHHIQDYLPEHTNN
ncbi:MAG: response regulator transcription factor [Anaerolineales bacterium]|nr:response regulator transcription factor [Anaerolineales bacterium]MCB9128650.1 response regulator transcription factor [Ardenticatenales bacterium]MCB9172882.1 response regulator transcription factor [Ardenticatenales bacterium]